MEKAIFDRAPTPYHPTPDNAGHDTRAERDFRRWRAEAQRITYRSAWRSHSMKTAFSTYRPSLHSEILDGVSQGKILWLKTIHAAPEWEVQAQGPSPSLWASMKVEKILSQ